MAASQQQQSGIVEVAVPHFLLKLWKLVEDEHHNYCIGWDETGCSFHIKEPFIFSKELLPQYFKHNNINSFIRQLNMYGFRKVSNIEKSGIKFEHDNLEFQHPYFVRGHPELLQYIKRKAPHSRAEGGGELQIATPSRGLDEVMAEVRSLREKQGKMSAKLTQMEKNNSALWREVGFMRQQHYKQKTIVNKLLHFLASLVHSNGSGGNANRPGLGKRPLLMLSQDGEAALQAMAAKSAKRSHRQVFNSSPNQSVADNFRTTFSDNLTGPIINDVTDDVDEDDQLDEEMDSTLASMIFPPTSGIVSEPRRSPSAVSDGARSSHTPDSIILAPADTKPPPAGSFGPAKSSSGPRKTITVNLVPSTGAEVKARPYYTLSNTDINTTLNTAGDFLATSQDLGYPEPIGGFSTAKVQPSAGGLTNPVSVVVSTAEYGDVKTPPYYGFANVPPAMVSPGGSRSGAVVSPGGIRSGEAKTSTSPVCSTTPVWLTGPAATQQPGGSQQTLAACPKGSEWAFDANADSPNAMDDYFDLVQTDLDSLRDILASGNFNIDLGSLDNLFDKDDQLNFSNSNEFQTARNNDLKHQIVGNELSLYQTPASLVDLSQVSPNTKNTCTSGSEPSRLGDFGAVQTPCVYVPAEQSVPQSTYSVASPIQLQQQAGFTPVDPLLLASPNKGFADQSLTSPTSPGGRLGFDGSLLRSGADPLLSAAAVSPGGNISTPEGPPGNVGSQSVRRRPKVEVVGAVPMVDASNPYGVTPGTMLYAPGSPLTTPPVTPQTAPLGLGRQMPAAPRCFIKPDPNLVASNIVIGQQQPSSVVIKRATGREKAVKVPPTFPSVNTEPNAKSKAGPVRF